MINFALFFNSFLSYIVLMVILVLVGAAGFALGRFTAKKKAGKGAQIASSADEKVSQ
ncbi:MAG: hypothetical protein K5891_11335 [Lachnospiraceae bacterium]|nr:hypothetical protein [Lachnospiraceae bacterium]